MADLGVEKHWLVSPTKEIDAMWIQVEIQQKTSMIARWKQDIEDMQKGKILDLQARVKLTELEIKVLQAKLKQAQSIQAEINSKG